VSWDLLDPGPDRLPSYTALYRRWEEQPWGVYALDLRADQQRWRSATGAERNSLTALARTVFVGFHHTEARVTDALAPYIRAMPREDQRLFLATQLADEARHTVFFDRYCREVLGGAPAELGGAPRGGRPWPETGIGRLAGEVLPAAAERLRAHPEDEAVLVEAVTVYHLIVEATVALTYQRLLLRFFKRLGGFPGFCAGMAGLLRDEVRHVLFGTRFLREMVHKDAGHGATVMRCVARLLPLLRAILATPPEQVPVLRALGINPDRRYALGVVSLRRHLQAVGLRVRLPGPV
jgi:ribonucleoside-diphosphate reductase beta chain